MVLVYFISSFILLVGICFALRGDVQDHKSRVNVKKKKKKANICDCAHFNVYGWGGGRGSSSLMKDVLFTLSWFFVCLIYTQFIFCWPLFTQSLDIASGDWGVGDGRRAYNIAIVRQWGANDGDIIVVCQPVKNPWTSRRSPIFPLASSWLLVLAGWRGQSDKVSQACVVELFREQQCRTSNTSVLLLYLDSLVDKPWRVLRLR